MSNRQPQCKVISEFIEVNMQGSRSPKAGVAARGRRSKQGRDRPGRTRQVGAERNPVIETGLS